MTPRYPAMPNPLVAILFATQIVVLPLLMQSTRDGLKVVGGGRARRLWVVLVGVRKSEKFGRGIRRGGW
jgi:hypothetical protein